MRAAILSIGTELMRGDIVDTNSTFLARELGQLGFDVVGIESVPDTLDRLTEAVTRARSTASVTLTTGGLGPTEDDLTRDAIAASLGEELYVDQSLVDEIEARFASMRRRMPASNHRQAMLIPSARPLRNHHGTAPGWLVERDGFLIVAMPGPPKEMQPMWCESVSPRLERLLPGHLAMLSLMTFGLGESAVEERVQDVIHRREDVTVATYAKEAG
ncbi:MAG TPA: molybdopterin-binding protein, partial [Chloroflexota bacterium]